MSQLKRGIARIYNSMYSINTVIKNNDKQRSFF